MKKKKFQICNLTLPEYLISTLLNPRWTPRHTHRPRKRKIDPKLPLLLSPVVRLTTPLVILSGPTAPPPLIPFNSNFSELDGRRLARLFCFFLNFSYIFAEYSDSYIVNICGIIIFKIAIIQWRIRLSQFLWEFVFLISIRVNFCDCVMWIISFSRDNWIISLRPWRFLSINLMCRYVFWIVCYIIWEFYSSLTTSLLDE